MLSRKNKDLRTIKEGVVGKYVKKETPPEMPSKISLHIIVSYLEFNLQKTNFYIDNTLFFIIFYYCFTCFLIIILYRIIKYNLFFYNYYLLLVINVWTTEPNRRTRNRNNHSTIPTSMVNSNYVYNIFVHK